jgi:dolichol-phosphate mannosyltransferase
VSTLPAPVAPGGFTGAAEDARGPAPVAAVGEPDAVPAAAPYLSIVIPILNEEASIVPLIQRVFAVVQGLRMPFEVVAVDDGSEDGSFRLLEQEAARRPQLKVLRFRRNYGQTAALMAGIDHAAGQVLVSLDADLQNDPADIPRLLSKLAEGYDVVSGWRNERQDAKLSRGLTSRVANRLISRMSGVRLNDYGCTLKAYRRDVVKGIKLYGEMHRFIPIYASWMGARVTEIPVRHHPRTTGASHYGMERVVKVLLDMIVVKFLDRHFVKPIYVFGGAGLASFACAVIMTAAAVWYRIGEGVPLIATPFPVLGAMFLVLGVASVLMGLLAEMTARTYFESQQRPAYMIRDSRNVAPDRAPSSREPGAVPPGLGAAGL